MPFEAILKFMGLQPSPAKKRTSRAKRHKSHPEAWEFIGCTQSYSMTVAEDLDRVPEWLKKEWVKIRGTSRTLGGSGKSPKA